MKEKQNMVWWIAIDDWNYFNVLFKKKSDFILVFCTSFSRWNNNNLIGVYRFCFLFFCLMAFDDSSFESWFMDEFSFLFSSTRFNQQTHTQKGWETLCKWTRLCSLRMWNAAKSLFFFFLLNFCWGVYLSLQFLFKAIFFFFAAALVSRPFWNANIRKEKNRRKRERERDLL